MGVGCTYVCQWNQSPDNLQHVAGDAICDRVVYTQDVYSSKLYVMQDQVVAQTPHEMHNDRVFAR